MAPEVVDPSESGGRTYGSKLYQLALVLPTLAASNTRSGGPAVPKGGWVAQRQEALSYVNNSFGTGPMARFGIECFLDLLNRHGAASCRCATRPVLRTRTGHPNVPSLCPTPGGQMYLTVTQVPAGRKMDKPSDRSSHRLHSDRSGRLAFRDGRSRRSDVPTNGSSASLSQTGCTCNSTYPGCNGDRSQSFAGREPWRVSSGDDIPNQGSDGHQAVGCD